MSSWWGVPLLLVAAVVPSVLLVTVWTLIQQARARRVVRRAVEQAAARHVGGLVPGQRRPTDPQPWWPLVEPVDGDR